MKPAVNGVHVREDVWKLPAWDDTLLWYARAMERMLSLPLNDFRGWRYQAAIHEYIRQFDPLADANDVLPSNAQQARFWTQCQHGSWYFLSWHRIYLGFFEQIVRDHIVALGGSADWALPYWNYSDETNPHARKVRSEFLDDNLPDGSPNALAMADRGRTPALAAQGKATGDFGVETFDVDLTCLKTVPFATVPGAAGFGGPKTGFEHSGGVIGDLEGVPHGSVHVAIGGWLGGFNTAGLDPLFWLHHCNIDRLWEVWRNRGPQFHDPTDPTWGAPLGTKFRLRNAAGTIVPLSANQVVDTTNAVLHYSYEDISDPFAGAGLAAEEEMGTGPAALVGASEAPVRLSAAPTTAVVRIDPVATEELAALAGDEEQRAYLNIENIVGRKRTTSYRVYVKAGGEGDGHYAGLLPMFGLVERSGRDDPHGGSGLSYALDITDLVRKLKQGDTWDNDKLNVTFVPAQGGEPDTSLKVGRISLYYR